MLTTNLSRALRSLSSLTSTRTAFTRSISSSTPAKMPLYIAYCPDYPNALERRKSVREQHLADATKDKETGASVFGRAFLSDEVSTTSPGETNADQLKGMAGSVMLLRFPTKEQAWDRIKADKYWTAGVWDKEKTQVNELIAGGAVDETIKIQ